MTIHLKDGNGVFCSPEDTEIVRTDKIRKCDCSECLNTYIDDIGINEYLYDIFKIDKTDIVKLRSYIIKAIKYYNNEYKVRV